MRPTFMRAIPLVHEEGCPRHKEKRREASFEGADGVVENAERFRLARPPRLLRFGGFAASCLCRIHPSSWRRGMSGSQHQGCHHGPAYSKRQRVGLSGSASAMSSGTAPRDPVATTMNCRPFIMYVMGRPVSFPGNSISKIVRPVFLSSARNFLPPP